MCLRAVKLSMQLIRVRSSLTIHSEHFLQECDYASVKMTAIERSFTLYARDIWKTVKRRVIKCRVCERLSMDQSE